MEAVDALHKTEPVAVAVGQTVAAHAQVGGVDAGRAATVDQVGSARRIAPAGVYRGIAYAEHVGVEVQEHVRSRSELDARRRRARAARRVGVSVGHLVGSGAEARGVKVAADYAGSGPHTARWSAHEGDRSRADTFRRVAAGVRQWQRKHRHRDPRRSHFGHAGAVFSAVEFAAHDVSVLQGAHGEGAAVESARNPIDRPLVARGGASVDRRGHKGGGAVGADVSALVGDGHGRNHRGRDLNRFTDAGASGRGGDHQGCGFGSRGGVAHRRVGQRAHRRDSPRERPSVGGAEGARGARGARASEAARCRQARRIELNRLAHTGAVGDDEVGDGRGGGRRDHSESVEVQVVAARVARFKLEARGASQRTEEHAVAPPVGGGCRNKRAGLRRPGRPILGSGLKTRRQKLPGGRTTLLHEHAQRVA